MRIECRLRGRRAALLCLALSVAAACSRRADKTPPPDSATMTPVAAEAPPPASYDCTGATQDMQKLVCGDAALAALDRKLGDVYKEAAAKQGSPPPAWFSAGQRDWIRERDACWTSSNQRACADSAYTLRIAELQARSMLVNTRGPVTYVCDNRDGVHDEVIAMFADTDPRSVILERGDKSIIAYGPRAGGGARYEAANVAFRERGGEAQLTWFGIALKCHEQAGTS